MLAQSTGRVLQFRDITPRGRSEQTYRMRDIDLLPGGRDNLVLVATNNPKRPGSRAYRNFQLYGGVGDPQVTVSEFLQSYPEEEGGQVRARVSLLWDLNHGTVRIVDAASIRRQRAA